MSDCPVISTAYGKVKGKTCLKAKAKNAKQVFRYSKIPFGKPPIGELRFEPPQKCESWEGVRDATKPSPHPEQDENMLEPLVKYFPAIQEFKEEETVEEDCLYLDVYTTNPNNKAKMPVMFFIYGGGLQSGSSAFYSGQVLCGLQDVVLVIPNYRVNIFGFLATGKNTAYPGNMGLLDQVLALEWTRDNIVNFGGDPDNVTIFGESAGAVSVSLHMLSPLSRGLFHKAIQNSGTSTFPGMVSSDYSHVFKQLADAFDMPDADVDNLIQKLKSMPANELRSTVGELAKKFVSFFATVDGKFLPDLPENLLKSNQLAPVPCIIGCNNSEGQGMLALNNPPSFFEGFSEEEFRNTMKGIIGFSFPQKIEQADKIIDTLKSFYNGKFLFNDNMRWSKMFGEINGDIWFLVPSIENALIHSATGKPTYFYYMTQQPKFNHDDEYAIKMKKKMEHCECDHGDDLMFTFGLPFMNGFMLNEFRMSKEEEELSKSWMTYITNFAKSGNPNEGEKVDYTWPQYDSESKRHLTVQMPIGEGSQLNEDRYKLWQETIKSI
ncbi:fatty acyl-CoA hydrolase precursor, medium chain-like [Clavelina lepadiformis]|uniref:fatty acyl-CoA hydrolase precursor, medium chain-like n=1 Tax=Clavelina lepadiformis TaxID=159417 RepID=UPI004041A068